MIRRPRVVLVLCAAYFVTMLLVTVGLVVARQAVLEQFGSPEALAEWRVWKAETERQNRAAGPVIRKPVTSDEPPALRLARDHFPAILAGTLVVGSFVFAFLAWTILGSLGTPSVQSDRMST